MTALHLVTHALCSFFEANLHLRSTCFNGHDFVMLIHCTETSGDLSSLQDTQSWTTLLRAAEIRQYTLIHADESIRKIATAKNDSKILAIASWDLVAAEGCYHRSCYKAYTWHKKSSTSTTSVTFENEESYARIVSTAYEMLFDHVRAHILETPKLVRLADLTRMMLCFMDDLGVAEAKESTFAENLRQSLEVCYSLKTLIKHLLRKSYVFVRLEFLMLLKMFRLTLRHSLGLRVS